LTKYGAYNIVDNQGQNSIIYAGNINSSFYLIHPIILFTSLSGGQVKDLRYSSATERITIQRITQQGREKSAEDLVTKERPLSIVLNNRELITLLCSPLEFDCLAVGFLTSEGLIRGKDEIKKITVDDKKRIVRIENRRDIGYPRDLLLKRTIISDYSGAFSFHSPSSREKPKIVLSTLHVSASEIFALVKQFEGHSRIFPVTGGVHSAALCNPGRILVFSEDIGRHNAIDKVFGRCMMDGISTDGRLLITSGRVSSEIVLKAAVRNIPVFISRSAPTDMGIRLAQDSGITLVGFVRNDRMNIYTYGERVDDNGNKERNNRTD
jgi:FdhD protein